jgi:transposase
MPEELTPEEVALLIRGKKILNAKGLPRNIDVSGICAQAGISRKTGYQWVEKLEQHESLEEQLKEELAQVRAEHEKLKRDFADVSFENRGRKLAWEIHKVDELLGKKGVVTTRHQRRKRL